MSYQFTPEELVDLSRRVSGNTITIGDDVIEGPKVGKGIVGRGNRGTDPGEGRRTGGNWAKGNAIQEIVKRGKGGGSDPNAWDAGDIGLVGKATGVSIEDLQNADNTLTLSRLKNSQEHQYLKAQGLPGAQWGDDEVSLKLRYQQAVKNEGLKESEPARVKLEEAQARARGEATNREIRANNEAGKRFAYETKVNEQTRSDNKDLAIMEVQGRIAQEQARLAAEERQALRDHKADMRSLDNSMASIRMENARLLQQDENNRADRKEKALYALIASLTGLGQSFAI